LAGRRGRRRERRGILRGGGTACWRTPKPCAADPMPSLIRSRPMFASLTLGFHRNHFRCSTKAASQISQPAERKSAAPLTALAYERGTVRAASRDSLAEVLLSPAVQRTIRAAPGDLGKTEEQARAFARRMLPKPNRLLQNLAAHLLGRTVDKLFDEFA